MNEFSQNNLAIGLNKNKMLSVSEAARTIGVSSSTLRLWEDHDLVQPVRTESGRRLYDADALERLRNIARMRTIQGLNINAIKRELEIASRRDTDARAPLGVRLKNLRVAHGLTLRDVSKQTGLAFSFVSAIERTSRGASMTSLKKLAECYNISVTELMEADAGKEKDIVVQFGSGKRIPILGPKVNIEQLTNSINTLDCQRWILKPGASSDGPYNHNGEEFIYVLRGNLSLNVEGYGEIALSEGDSANFQSSLQHSWQNSGKVDAEVIWINTPPTF